MSTISGINLENTKYNITLPLLASGFTTTAGSSTSGSYLAAKWAVANVNGITTPVDGMTIAVRVPLAGNSGGVLLSIDGGTKYYPIVRNVNTLVTTTYAVGSTVILTFNATQTASPYLTAGTETSVTGCWQVADYDSNTTYTNVKLGHGYTTCSTAAGTVAKTASLSSYTLTTGGIVAVRFTNGNTASSPTLNIASKGAKSIYYNGAALTDTSLIKAGDVVTFIYSTQYHIIAINRYDDYAPIDSPEFTGSISLGRKSGTTIGANSVALGGEVEASGEASFAVGYSSATELASFAAGSSIASGQASHATCASTASGYCSHSEGLQTEASGQDSHAEGMFSIASEAHSHAEGSSTTASGHASHAEGEETVASGVFAHAEGNETIASGQSSHAEGWKTEASGSYAHTEGLNTIATKFSGHAEGYYTIASSNYQHVQGQFNLEDATDTYAHIVGNGEDYDTRSNAHTLDWDGNAWFAGDVYVGGTNQTTGSSKLAKEGHAHSDYVSKSSTAVQTIAGGLVVGKTSTSGVSGTGVGRIMFTGQSNPLIGVQSTDSSGTGKTPYYIQTVASDDKLYIGPTSAKALNFDSNGNMSSPANLSISGTISEGGTALSSKYAPISHNQASSTINAMTGYSKPSSTSAIAVSDTLNAAIGKLEKALDGKGTSNLAIGTTSTTAAAGNHTHSTYAPLASPTFTGTPKAPTATAGTNTTQIATTAFVTAAVSGKANSSHNQAASTITAGTLAGKVVANATAVATLTNAQIRNIQASTTDLTAGTSSLTTGDIYLVYE